jgi:Protein kinase domain/Domain of unknown function (DUF4384)
MNSEDDDRFERDLREAAKDSSTNPWLPEAVVPAADPPEWPLPHTFGRYELHEKLGGGAMGSVYKATQLDMDRLVALKVIKPGRSGDDLRQRFRREIHATRLAHDHLVRAYDAGEYDGCPYLAMELLHGADLSELLNRHGRLPFREACELARQAALGLAHAHDHGIVHRDIKPANLFLTASTLKVLDLGLARVHGTGNDPTLTTCVMGTPFYMPPEQWADSHSADHRADFYALGASLYHLLAGRPVFSPDEFPGYPGQLYAHQHERPCLLTALDPTLPAGLADLVDRLLRKNPAERMPDDNISLADEFAIFANGAKLERLTEPHAPRAVSALDPIIDLFVFGRDPANLARRSVGALGSVQQNMTVWVEAKAPEDRHLYLFWLDSSGRVTPLYPWTPGDWSRMDADEPGGHVKRPQDERGFTIDTPAGMETVIACVSRNRYERGDLESRLERMSKVPVPNDYRGPVRFTFQPTARVSEHRISVKPTQPARPLDDLRDELVRRLGGCFEMIQVLSVANTG